PDETVTARRANPKAELQYQINREDMTYALVAKGFRPGGLVPSVPQSACGSYIAEINPNLTANDLRRYNPDSLWNYEVGAKTGW
ncbi:hypothetical protein ACJENL_27385, partial [Escherichia coli]